MYKFAVAAWLALAFLLSGCTYGRPIEEADRTAPGLPTESSFRHLSAGICPLLSADASATVITPRWAVTAQHVADIIGGSSYTSRNFDLAWIPISGGGVPRLGTIRDGDPIWAYGSGCGEDTRFAVGRVILTNASHCFGAVGIGNRADDVASFCEQRDMGVARGFLFDADIGGGFSGGPVYNAKGELVGVIQGVIHGEGAGAIPKDRAVGFAYHIGDVVALAPPLRRSDDRSAPAIPYSGAGQVH